MQCHDLFFDEPRGREEHEDQLASWSSCASWFALRTKDQMRSGIELRCRSCLKCLGCLGACVPGCIAARVRAVTPIGASAESSFACVGRADSIDGQSTL